MSYRPITDVWFLARAKYSDGRKRYGAYLGGFPERARALIGANIEDPVLHACGGLAHLYPYRGGYGPNDSRLDLDPEVQPEFLQDVHEPWPTLSHRGDPWRAILIDPPYSEKDAEQYSPGPKLYPAPNLLMKQALEVLGKGDRVGLIHYMLPGQPKNTKFIACVAIYCGFNNRARTFSVFEKL